MERTDYLITQREAVDFCVWVLEVDGLRVDVFDHHRDGSHVLREAGLTANGWRVWMSAVAAHQRLLIEWEWAAQRKGKIASDHMMDGIRNVKVTYRWKRNRGAGSAAQNGAVAEVAG